MYSVGRHTWFGDEMMKCDELGEGGGLDVNFDDGFSVVRLPDSTLPTTSHGRTYTVTRPYELFRHPDRMAPESTVRGRENISPVRPG